MKKLLLFIITLPQFAFSQNIYTIAGNGLDTFSGDGGPAIAAAFSAFNGISIDDTGNIYFADCYNNRVRKINNSGIVTTFAGSVGSGFAGDGYAATAASLYQPLYTTIDKSGNVYIAVNDRIRVVNTSGIINTFAGNGGGTYSGDNGPATAAGFTHSSSFVTRMPNIGVCNARNFYYLCFMAGDRYVIQDQHAIHFLTFTTVDWIDIFTRQDYKYVITGSLNHCIEEKGLECFAWVLMSNHLHLVARTNPPFLISDFMRDFKKFTSKKIVKIMQTINESRKEWILHHLNFEANRTGRAENYKLWQDSNHPVCLEGRKDWFLQRIDYTHQNPVRQMIVANAADYLFSSACDYEGRQGLVKVSIER